MDAMVNNAIGRGEDPQELGKRLVREAKHGLQGKPAFALLLVSSKISHQKLLEVVTRELGPVPLIGCTTAGEFTESAVMSGAAALSLVAESDQHRFHVALAGGLKADVTACVQKALEAIPPAPAGYPHRSAIILHDGLAGRGEETVLSAGMLLGPDISFTGGSAADDLAFKETFVYCNGKAAKDAVALAVIDSKKPVSVGVKHGHSPVSQQLTVTKAQDNILYEVDGQPAWEVWKRELKKEAQASGIDVEQLTDPSQIGQFLIRYELGLHVGQEEYKVRVPLSKNEDGSLNFACTISEGAKFRIMKSPKEDQITSAKIAAQRALEGMQGNPIAGALVFDCVCRGIILGEEFYRGVAAIQTVLGEVPLVGFETYGEICRRSGQTSGYHNTTTVVMLLPA